MTPLLEVIDVTKHFRTGGGLFGGGDVVHAVDGVTFRCTGRRNAGPGGGVRLR